MTNAELAAIFKSLVATDPTPEELLKCGGDVVEVIMMRWRKALEKEPRAK